VVRLPVRPDAEPLGNSREQAERRLVQLKRRFKKQPNLKHEYNRFMDEYLEVGHMVEVKPNLTSHNEYFLPHHCVLRKAVPLPSLELYLMVVQNRRVEYHSIRICFQVLLSSLNYFLLFLSSGHI
jgi:hypothetical protein